MLAYVFRHWPSQSSDRGDYEATHLQFHQSIANESPAGFHRSFVFRLVKASWIAATGPIYEDWYLVENFAALESLNEGAVSGKNRSSHDRIAQRASGGSGALYRLRVGEPHVAKARMALWFSKPRGLPYPEFYAGVSREALDSGGGLWERQMVLGPSPECCLLLATRRLVPKALDTEEIPLELVWGGDRGASRLAFVS
jgi:hypothetical protein